jgi:hypothetical protein
MSKFLAEIRRVLRPPSIVAVTRRPAGWFAVSRGLRDVIAWAQLEDGQVVGLVAGRRGLRPAAGRGFRGYLPAAPHGAHDIQLSPPAVTVPVADLQEALGEEPWTSEAQLAIYDRLRTAADSEWATKAFCAFIADPDRFLRRHGELRVEHAHAAELDAGERAFLAGLIPSNHDVRARVEASRERRTTK